MRDDREWDEREGGLHAAKGRIDFGLMILVSIHRYVILFATNYTIQSVKILQNEELGEEPTKELIKVAGTF